MAKTMDKQRQEELKQARQLVAKKYLEFAQNPQSILETNSDGKFEKIENFYNDFAEAYIFPDIEDYQQYYKNKTLPRVELKDANSVRAIPNANAQSDEQKNNTSAKGEYNSNDNKVYMYFNTLQELKNKGASNQEIITTFNSLIELLCHEYQHGKQQLYQNILASGDIDVAKDFSSQLGKQPEAIAEDMSFNGFESIELIRSTREDLYSKLKGNRSSSHKGADPVREAFYYHRPIEVDARTTSLKVFKQFSTDVLKSKKIKPVVGLFKEALSSFQGHIKDLLRQKPISKQDLEESIKQLRAEDFVKFVRKIEESYSKLNEEDKEKVSLDSILTGNSQSDDERDREVFVCALKDYVSTNPEKASELINEIKLQCQREGLSFGEKIATQYLKQLEGPSVRPVNKNDYKQEEINPNETQSQIQIPTDHAKYKTRETHTLSSQEEQQRQ